MSNKIWIEVLDNGLVYSCGRVPNGVVPSPMKNGEMVEVDSVCVPSQSAYLDGKVVAIQAPPSYYAVFDPATRTWTDTRSLEFCWEQVRTLRNEKLLASDWTQLPDVPDATKEAWAAYRQALRDITNQSDPKNIQWPVSPNET